MTIQSDGWIITQCVPPTHVITVGEELAWTGITHDPADLDRMVRQGAAMSIHPSQIGMDIDWTPMIEPFIHKLVREEEVPDAPEGVWQRKKKVLSYGVSSFGYDVRLTEEFQIFSNANGGVIDPKRFDQDGCLLDGKIRIDEHGDKYVILPPNSYLLARTAEYFRIPRDVMVICVGKSTYARAGAIVNVTPIEAGFEGNVVIEVSNSTTLPLKIYANEGIAQFLFFKGDEPCMTSYADRGGKYQGQTGITHSKV